MVKFLQNFNKIIALLVKFSRYFGIHGLDRELDPQTQIQFELIDFPVEFTRVHLKCKTSNKYHIYIKIFQEHQQPNKSFKFYCQAKHVLAIHSYIHSCLYLSFCPKIWKHHANLENFVLTLFILQPNIEQIIEFFLPNQACPGSRLQGHQLPGLAEKIQEPGLAWHKT